MDVKVLQTVLSTVGDKTTQPERKLIAAVITQALRDLTDAKHRADARAFFKSAGFDHFCDCLELNAAAIREKVL